MRKRSIGERLKTLKTFQSQEEALTAWAKNWKSDQENVIFKLRRAAMHDDHDTIMHMIDQLQGMTEKRFSALNNVARIVSNPQRQLIDRPHDTPEISSDLEMRQDQDIEKDQILLPTVEETLPVKIINAYKQGRAIQEISDMHQVSFNKCVKILVTEGIYHSETYDKILSMRDAGITDEEIGIRLKIKKSAMDKYTPYKKGVYLSETPTENALRIRKCREKIK